VKLTFSLREKRLSLVNFKTVYSVSSNLCNFRAFIHDFRDRRCFLTLLHINNNCNCFSIRTISWPCADSVSSQTVVLIKRFKITNIVLRGGVVCIRSTVKPKYVGRESKIPVWIRSQMHNIQVLDITLLLYIWPTHGVRTVNILLLRF